MKNKDIQKKYSLRKFKGVGLASAVIGLFFANGTVVSAAVSSNGTDTVTLVSDTSKVASTSATTFTDDTSSKSVKVDAVLGKGVDEPTKANFHTEDADGNDVLKYRTEADIFYKLKSDDSILDKGKYSVGEVTVTTPFDKKGIAYDTDGKYYRESTADEFKVAIESDAGKKDTITANGKVYEYDSSKVENADSVTYDKTNFNNIEASVSPEEMHNNSGEINYENITGKIYLVEETSDGHYGKFVEATNINSDDDAVAAWKNGQATANDFTKENVTLQKGDTILVLDRDTYAKSKEESIYTNKGVVTISDNLSTIKVINTNKTTKEETDYVTREIITPVRAYQVMGEGEAVVTHYYNLKITREEVGEEKTTKQGSVVIKYVTTDGKRLKSETDKDNVTLETKNIVSLYSGETKVDERVNVATVEQHYDTTPRQYPTLVDVDTGFTYEYVGLKQGSPEASGKVVEGTTEVVYEYRLVSEEEKTPKVTETKGSVVVKYVDTDGNEIKDAEKVVTDAVVKTTKTYTTKSGNVVISTRDEVENHEVQYNTTEKKVETITKDGKKYNYQGIYASSEKFHNIAAETGKVVEGITTIVYQYQLKPEKIQWEVSQNPAIVEVPEYTGGTSLPEAPINEVQEFAGGAVAVEPPIVEVLEYTGGTSLPEVPINEVQEFAGRVIVVEPLIYTKPTLIITKWVDENGDSLKPADVKEPIELGQSNEAFEHGTVEGYKYIETVRNQEGDVVTHVFRKLNSESKVPNTLQKNSEKPKQEEQKVPEVAPESPKNEVETPKETPTSYSVALPQANQLPQTGTGDELALVSAATTAILAGLGIVRPRKKQ